MPAHQQRWRPIDTRVFESLHVEGTIHAAFEAHGFEEVARGSDSMPATAGCASGVRPPIRAHLSRILLARMLNKSSNPIRVSRLSLKASVLESNPRPPDLEAGVGGDAGSADDGLSGIFRPFCIFCKPMIEFSLMHLAVLLFSTIDAMFSVMTGSVTSIRCHT
jgi:hypothetical protein